MQGRQSAHSLVTIHHSWSPVLAAGVAACLLLAPQGAPAQSWKPERAVEIIVPCQPGCGPDIAARTIQRIWQEQRIVPVASVVVNKAGGGGAVAYGYLQ